MVTKTLEEVLSTPPMYGLNAAACGYVSGASRYIRITDITDDGKYRPSDNAYVLSSDERYLLHDNDILLARTGASVGKSYLFNENDGKLIFAGFLIKVTIDPQKAVARYIFECFHTENYWNWVRSESARSGQPGINSQQYADFILHLPPLPEQRRIAEALSDMDALIAAMEKLIAKKRAIKQGAMQELLTGKRRLPGFAGEWIKKPLMECCNLLQGLTYTPRNVQSYGLLVLRSSNIQDGKLSFSDCVFVNCSIDESKYVQPNDILICVRNGSSALIGKSCVIDKTYNATFGAFMSVLRGDETGYIANIFASDIVQNQIRNRSSATINQITKHDFENIIIPIPPTKPEQTAIAEILSDMDAEIDALTAKLNKLRNIKQGMMSELLTGRIRLAETDKAKTTKLYPYPTDEPLLIAAEPTVPYGTKNKEALTDADD